MPPKRKSAGASTRAAPTTGTRSSARHANAIARAGTKGIKAELVSTPSKRQKKSETAEDKEEEKDDEKAAAEDTTADGAAADEEEEAAPPKKKMGPSKKPTAAKRAPAATGKGRGRPKKAAAAE